MMPSQEKDLSTSVPDSINGRSGAVLGTWYLIVR